MSHMAAEEPCAHGTAAAGRAAATAAAASLQHPLPFRLLPTGAPTDWDPASAEVTLNVRLDGCIVPSEASPEGARISYSHAGGWVAGGGDHSRWPGQCAAASMCARPSCVSTVLR